MDYKKISYKKNKYAVVNINHNNIDYPLVLDWVDFKAIKKLNKKWKYGPSTFVSCYHLYQGTTKEVFIHDLTMALKNKAENNERQKKPIVHLNKIGLDNRRENIIYDVQNKTHNKNIKKKKRTIDFPKDSGVTPEELPTYVWYLKPNGTHGERFMVKVGDVVWKTTASKKLSLRYKLEEAKKYLRELKKTRNEIFDNYSMNGDFTKKGSNLLNEYYDIVEKAKYNNIIKVIKNKSTDKFLKEKTIAHEIEKDLLKDFGLLNNERRRRSVNNLPKDFLIKSQDLPKYSYYCPQNNKRGGYFVVNNHPKQSKIWQSSSSKKISLKAKYENLLNYVNILN